MSDAQNSCARVSGVVTLIVTCLVMVAGVSCMIWSRFGVANIEIFGTNDLALLEKCATDVSRSRVGSFSCSSSSSCSSKNLAGYTVCGLPPGCICYSSASNNFLAGIVGAKSVAEVIKAVINFTGWFNFAAGASAVLGALPVLIGAIGKVAGNDGLANACGVTGIVFEVCCGLFFTWGFAAAAYAIAQVATVFGVVIWTASSLLANNITASGLGIGNTCPLSCQQATNSIRDGWITYAVNSSWASNLAFLAAAISIVALVCTCVGFCIQRRSNRAGTYAGTTTTTTNITVNHTGHQPVVVAAAGMQQPVVVAAAKAPQQPGVPTAVAYQ